MDLTISKKFNKFRISNWESETYSDVLFFYDDLWYSPNYGSFVMELTLNR